MTSALDEIAEERRRQIEVEGWTAEHDDRHDGYEMARAAGCYAMHAGNCHAWTGESYSAASLPPFTDLEAGEIPWPWDIDWWKPKNPRRDLIRAAALIVAEIERIDRLATRARSTHTGAGER